MTKDQLEESALVEGLRRGDQHTVQLWYRQYASRLQRFVLSRVSNQKDAEEIVQDTFISCLESVLMYSGHSSFWTWMCSIARHEVSDYFRKKYAKRVLQLIPFADALLPTQLHNMHTVSNEVQRVLSRMSSREREILLMKYVDGWDVATIAQQLRVSLKSAESLLFRARKQFRVMYAMEEDGE